MRKGISMKFKKMSTTNKLYIFMFILFIILCLPFIALCSYCFLNHRNSLSTKLLFFLLAVTLIGVSFLFAHIFILTPISRISKAVTEIFKDYIDSSIVKDEQPDSDSTDNRKRTDDTVRLMHHVQNIMDKEYKAEMLRKQAELNALQSQINPHFLYNTLESIRGQAVFEGVDTIAEMAKSLSDFFRYSIQSKEPLVPLHEELHIVESYVKIQNYRFNNKYEIHIQLDDDTLKQIEIPRLTLQPIVENALLHGLRNSIRATEQVRIHAFSTRKRVIISVSDQGCGIEEELLEKLNYLLSKPLAVDANASHNTVSIGLNNINERIKLHYGNEYGLKLFSSFDHGTTVEISLPLTKSE